MKSEIDNWINNMSKKVIGPNKNRKLQTPEISVQESQNPNTINYSWHGFEK